MTLQQSVFASIRAAEPLIWIRSNEYLDATHDVADICRERCFNLLTWDCVRGLEQPGHREPPVKEGQSLSSPSPSQKLIAAIRQLSASAGPEPIILLISNLHRFTQANEVVQEIQNFCRGSDDPSDATQRCIINLAPPSVPLIPEFAPLFSIIDHALPSKEELRPLLMKTSIYDAKSKKDICTSEEDADPILEASKGLTRLQASSIYARAMTSGKITPAAVAAMKNDFLNAEKLIIPYHGAETFADVGGLNAMKDFFKKAMTAEARKKSSRIRGVLCTGVSGVGKSACVKALAGETGLPLYQIDFGRTKGSLVGESEQRMRQILATIDALSPAIVLVDEIEKQVTGGRSLAHETDTHLLGSLLSWLNDHTSDVLFCATANDVSQLPPELLRAGRIDAIFFAGLPGAEQKKQIWGLYLDKFNIPDQKLPDDAKWTGAEIQACCRMADALGISLKEAATFVIPVATRAGEKLDELSKWAEARAIDAELGGVYRAQGSPAPVATDKARRRRVVMPPTSDSN